LVVWTFVLVVVAPVGMTLIYRFVPPPLTILMVQRVFEGKGLDYRWRPIDRISPALVQAAIASEDAKFCEHHGFDFEAMEKAMEANKRRPGRLRGGSTISQQTAKNVFLWPGKGVTRYIRKGLEVYSTVLIETLWGKRRIMEVYLNVAEMGAGTYGAEAAAQRYFGIPASQLTRAQAARLVAILPNPLKYKAVGSGPYVSRRTRRIGAAAGTVRNDGLAACVGKLRPPTGRERQDVAPSQMPNASRPSRPEVVKINPPAIEAPEVQLEIIDPPPNSTREAPVEPPPSVENPAFKTTD
jgi:monofunctional biosynthetic peptidoglycan transglycosylase